MHDTPAVDLRARLLDENAGQSRLYARDAEILIANAAEFPPLVAAANRTGEEVAEFLAEHDAVAQVWYPKRTDRKRYDAVRREGGGYGGQFTTRIGNVQRWKYLADWQNALFAFRFLS